MDGRGSRVGVTLLVVAVLIMVLPVLLRSRSLAGSATAAPLPEPPQVGECLALDRRTVVGCDLPHYSEVTARWTADDPERRAVGDWSDRCEIAATEFMDFTASWKDWHIFLRSRAERLDAPSVERLGPRGWTICTVTVSTGGLYSGSLRSLTAADRPAATATCVQGDDGAVVPCDQPHDAEQLAMTWQTQPDPAGLASPPNPDGSFSWSSDAALPPGIAETVDAQCVQVAAVVLATPDPTRGGLLTVDTRGVFLADRPGVGLVNAECSIRSADGRPLVGSLIGLGDAMPTFG